MPDRKKIYLCINIYSLILQKHEKLTYLVIATAALGDGSLYGQETKARIRCLQVR